MSTDQSDWTEMAGILFCLGLTVAASMGIVIAGAMAGDIPMVVFGLAMTVASMLILTVTASDDRSNGDES